MRYYLVLCHIFSSGLHTLLCSDQSHCSELGVPSAEMIDEKAGGGRSSLAEGRGETLLLEAS